MLLWRVWARVVQQFDGRSTAEAWRPGALRRWLAVCMLALLGATWKLWTPQDVYPQVPLFTFWNGLPAGLEWAALALAGGSLLVVLLVSRGSKLWRFALLFVVVAVCLLFCGDQHRLQPWAYQFVLLAVVLAVVEPWRAIVLARMLTVSIYLFSALSKLDQTFLTTIGPQFRDTFLGWFGVTAEHSAVVAVFPLGELAVALLLVFRPTRTLGWVASLVMHSLMLLILGPLGLGHSWSVLLWNVYFVGQNMILFAPARRSSTAKTPTVAENSPAPTTPSVQSQPRFVFCSILAETLLVAALLWPTLQIFGLCDNWIAWGLYAPRAERVEVRVEVGDVDRLPMGCQQHLAPSTAGEGWRRLRLDQWSLAALGVPIYPQNRFQLGVALAVAEATDPMGQFQVVAYGRANPITGRRSFREYWGPSELRGAERRYWIGVAPRDNIQATAE